jgi:DNA-binding NarL/FixJ family response regulator
MCLKTYSNPVQLVNDLNKGLKIDFILLDINIFGKSSLEYIKVIKTINKSALIYIFTVYEDVEYLLKALKLGADGYLLKDIKINDIENIIVDGIGLDVSSVMSPRMAQRLIDYFKKESNNEFNELKTLTVRELEVLNSLADGFEYNEIAGIHNISVNSIRSHIKNIYKKLHVSNGIQAVKKYWDNKDLLKKDDFNH